MLNKHINTYFTQNLIYFMMQKQIYYYTIIARPKGVVFMVCSFISHDSCHFSYRVSYQNLFCTLPMILHKSSWLWSYIVEAIKAQKCVTRDGDVMLEDFQIH